MLCTHFTTTVSFQVPKPTTNGEIWVFNRSYTQYIPLSIYDLQVPVPFIMVIRRKIRFSSFFLFVNWLFYLKTWMGAPSIYVYDCNNAGIIVESFKTFAEQHEREYAEQIRNIHSQGGSPDIQPPTSLR
jgi:regulator-associated protein of mTOR